MISQSIRWTEGDWCWLKLLIFPIVNYFFFVLKLWCLDGLCLCCLRRCCCSCYCRCCSWLSSFPFVSKCFTKFTVISIWLLLPFFHCFSTITFSFRYDFCKPVIGCCLLVTSFNFFPSVVFSQMVKKQKRNSTINW